MPHVRTTNRRAFLTTSLLVASLVAIPSAAVAAIHHPGAARAAVTPHAVFTAKGPVGWDTLRNLQAFDTIPQGVQTHQFSSTDPAQNNNDQGHCLRSIGSGGCVMAEATGAGEIDSIWMTSIDNGVNGDLTALGNLVVVLDGKTIINAPADSVVNGSLGAPFEYPLVANASQSSGGDYIDVPMTYTSSMLVYTTATPFPDYYHVTYRSFADATGVSTFDPTDTASDVLSMLDAAGTADPKPAQPGATTTSTGINLAPGASVTLGSLTGPATIDALQLHLPQLAPPPSQQDPADDGRAFGSGGSSQFTMAIDPDNQGVRLTRRLDQSIGNQVADISVDGTPIGQWAPLPASPGNYVDEAVDIPASITAGQSQITIKNTFVSSDLDFNEFHYWADSLVDGSYVRTDTLDVGPDSTASEAAHSYSITGQTWAGLRNQGSRQYAPASVPLLTDTGRAFGAGGSSTFTMAINPSNSGVTLTRRLDAGIADQVANVSVDGTSVGQWAPLPGQPGNERWADEAISIPASLTAGKSSITITNTFVSSSVDFNEFHYWADSIVNGQPDRTDDLDIGNSASEAAHDYSITGQTWSGSRTFGYVPQAVLDSNAVLAGVQIRISFDGTQTVNAPLGQFYGSAGYDGTVRSLMTGMDPGGSGDLDAWWPMPFASSAVVSLYNGSGVALSGGTASITSAPCSTCASQLSSGTIGYFHATANSTSAANQVAGQDYQILHVSGHGKFVGVALGMTGPASPAYYRGYLEGNERVYVDGSRTPDPLGTGTEDYFSSGWYFTNGPYTLPFNGNPIHLAGNYGCPVNQDCTSAYRLAIDDAVPFTTSLTYGIEHGATDNVAADYSSTAFWYGESTATQKVTDTLTIGNAASEQAHGYSSSDAGRTQETTTFQGNDGAAQPVTLTRRATQSPVSFTLAVASTNTGATIDRTSDQNQGYQEATVTVNGQAAGTWLEPWSNIYHRWRDDSFQVPSAITAGQSTLHVTLTPVSGSAPWTAAQYQARSQVPPFTDSSVPATVTGVIARALSSTAVSVTWAPVAGADHYAVYAAQGGAPSISPADLVGTTPVPSFVHQGLAAGQDWHYRVAAVSASGISGAASSDISLSVQAPVKIEAESLVSTATGTAPAQSQSNCCGVTWSGGAQLWITATAASQYVTLTFSVPTAGLYDISAPQTLAHDYGIAQVSVDGTRLGSPVDGYAPNVEITDAPQDYGQLSLPAGNNTITITLTGNEPWAANYYAGYDYFLFSPAS
jgi:hypothetical protein